MKRFGYIHKYQSQPDSKITGIRRTFDAIRSALKKRDDIDWIGQEGRMPFPNFKRTFLEEGNWLDQFQIIRNCACLVFDVIPLYERDFQNTYFWWKPKFDAIKHYEKIFVPSNWVKKTLVEDLGVSDEKIQVVYLGYDHKTFKPKKVNREEWCKAKGIDPNRILFGHVSYGYTRKNLERVFKAICQNPNITLIKIGEDVFTPSLVQQVGVEPQVKILPAMTDAELAEFYNVIDLFVFPSTSEGFGLPPLEAQACGCPVVMANTTALAEIIGPFAVGVDPFSVAEIKKAILNPPPRGTPDKEWLSRFDWKNLGKAVNEWLT